MLARCDDVSDKSAASHDGGDEFSNDGDSEDTDLCEFEWNYLLRTFIYLCTLYLFIRDVVVAAG